MTVPTASRRTVLRALGVGAGVAAMGAATAAPLPLLGARPAGATPTGRLVVVFLRGGIDGLSVCVPHTEAAYHDARPTIAVPDSAVIDLDGQFGLHPAMAPVHGLYQEDRFAIAHAVGNPAGNRSHFEAQAYIEQGTDGTGSDGLGWLARHLNSSSGLPDAQFRAVAIAPNTPRSLGGFVDTLTVPDLQRFGLGGISGQTENLGPQLHLLYTGDTLIDGIGKDTLAAIDEISGLVPPDPNSGNYDEVSVAFGDAATLLSAGLGIEVITVDIGGWDTHNDMGTHTTGQMTDLLSSLAQHLADFQTALDAGGQRDVTTLLISDFGRRVSQNGSGGTDHGKGNVVMAMGANLVAGQVVTHDWPTVAVGARDDGDLAMDIDYRDVLCEVTGKVLGHPDPAVAFPGHTCGPVGLIA
ncbi:MAG: DUF1501 domain-containing protein [Acidimicrobiia bacterium]|nr:DUF1501 domain-containing protein [Acidimicrobiia bacterium]